MKSNLLKSIFISLILLMGVSNAWAYNFKNPHIYFNNTSLKLNPAMLLVGHNSYSIGYNQTSNPIDNTNLVYFHPSADWGDQDGFTIGQGSNWGGDSNQSFTKRAAYLTNHIGLKYSYNFDYEETYYVTGTAGNNPTISVEYKSAGYSGIPKYNATQAAKLRNDISSSYTTVDGTWPTTLKLKGTYLSGNGSSARSEISGTASGNAESNRVYGAVVTGKITHTYNTITGNYIFEGWGTGTTPSTTNASYEYNITANTTVYAFFTKAYTVTYGKKGESGSSTVSATVTANSTTKSINSGTKVAAGSTINLTANPASGYRVVGWYSDANCTNQLQNGGNTYNAGTLTAAKTVYVKFEETKYDVTIQAGANGSVYPNGEQAVGSSNGLEVTANPNLGYKFTEWVVTGGAIVSSTTTNPTTLTATSSGTLTANFTANQYTITYNTNGGSGTMTPTSYTIETATFDLPTPTKTGYTFEGWYTASDFSGSKVTQIAQGSTGNKTFYAQWTANTYTVTLDQTGAAKEGSTTSVDANFEGNMPAITGEGALPTPQIGYTFMGYFDQEGTQYYKADGTSERPWDKTENTTLYAYFQPAKITNITLDKEVFEPISSGKADVTVTPTIDPSDIEGVVVCWRLLYSNGDEVAEHPASSAGDNKVKFSIVGLATGTYTIEATLHATDCGNGEPLSTLTKNFIIASEYTVTVKYTCDEQEIKASTTAPAQATETTSITAPDIFGYTFSAWEAGDGVEIKTTSADKKTITYTAIYNGTITAKYTKKKLIYFKRPADWGTTIYYYNIGSADKWKESGDGDKGLYTNEINHGAIQMTRIGDSDVYYYDYEATPNTNDDPGLYIAFADAEQNGYTPMWHGCHVSWPIERTRSFNEGTPMFVAANYIHYYWGANYYNAGYWTNYVGETGYTLKIYDKKDGDRKELYSIPFEATTENNIPFKAVVDLEAGKTYGFKFVRANGIWYKNDKDGTMTNDSHTDWPFIWDNENGSACGITTTAAGDYTFTLNLNNATGNLQISVDYPAAVGDYRILYRDNGTTNWSGNPRSNNWCHPSRIIKTKDGANDTISFFINKNKEPQLLYQTIKSINASTGAITWNAAKVFEDVKWNVIEKDGVINFTFTQSKGAIAVTNIELYKGNYYIRTDAMGGGWEDYKTNPDNRMFYSAFSESDANSFGDKFSHYATKWCEAGTNVKFTIANDYSHCISDTLAQDIIPLGNLTDEGTLLNNDIYDANIRFMWNRRTNKISRAYVGPAGDKQSQFLMLQSCSEFKDAAGNDLDPNEGDILDKENNIYAARFTDTQNWIYERTIKVKPGTRVKLYASYPNGYHIYIEDQARWEDVALYAFKDGGDQPLGNWPGIQPTRTVEIEGKTYYDFPVNKYVFGSKLIFNNTKDDNDGGQKKDDYQIQTIGDYYLTASPSDSKLSRVKFVSTTVEAKAQYFRGEYAEGSCDDEHTIQILGGEGETWNTIRVIYDFKTNRLMAAWMPNNNEIDTVRIESDVMIIRDHQNAAQCITFANDSSKLTAVKTVYGVMRFNRWILNNRGGADNLDIKSCTKMVDNQTVYDHDTINKYHPILETAKQTSQYERALYFISFPFDVHLSDVFGFGTYGQHWIIEYYDGLKRAKEGYWIDSDPNWKYVTDPANFVLEKYKGYILCLNLGKMAYDNTDFWAHNISQVELFFPSTTTMEEIAKAEVTMPALGDEYLCTINRNTPEGDRRVKDSYWRCIGVPSYANYSNVLKDEEGDPIQWQTSYKTFPFLYKWNKTDNTLTPQSTTNFKFETMHAYLVQNGGEIHWSAVNATPDKPNAGIIAKVKETTRNYEWRIAISRNGEVEDQAFVRLSDDEQVTTEFDFNQDLSKEFNYGRSDIYTLIGYEKVAANSLPLSEQTTLIPLGLSIEYNGDYTIAMPDGTANIGVTLIDTESNTRTNLSAGMEYTLTLKKGDYNNRFFIEISPIQQTPTDIEYVENSHDDQARKVLIDNILYIVRDGQIFDARGARVK